MSTSFHLHAAAHVQVSGCCAYAMSCAEWMPHHVNKVTKHSVYGRMITAGSSVQMLTLDPQKFVLVSVSQDSRQNWILL